MHHVIETIIKRNPKLKWINRGTVLLVRHGSHAYGTNVATSDEDFKGVTIPPKEYFFGGLNLFEQAELKAPDPDAVIYDIRKFFHLATDCNPNIIEVLHTDPSDHFIVDPIGEMILDHRNDFLSKKIKQTFMGYAVSQLKRIQTHRRWLLNPPKAPPTRAQLGLPEQTLIPADQLMAAQAEVQKELDRFQFDFMEGLEESTKIGIRNTMSEMIAELEITADQHWMAAARKIGFNDNLIEVMQRERQYSAAKREWDQFQVWKKTRNPARAALEEKFGLDTKHLYHLVRLTRMAEEAQTTGKIIVKRIHDREELLAIRNGTWDFDQAMDYMDKTKARLDVLYKTSRVLPELPDKNKIDQLLIELVEKSLSTFSLYNVQKILKGL